MTEERVPIPKWQQEYVDPLSDDSIQAAIDALSDEDRDRLVRAAARRLAAEGVVNLEGAGEQWIGACYDIMRSLSENGMTLHDVEDS